MRGRHPPNAGWGVTDREVRRKELDRLLMRDSRNVLSISPSMATDTLTRLVADCAVTWRRARLLCDRDVSFIAVQNLLDAADAYAERIGDHD